MSRLDTDDLHDLACVIAFRAQEAEAVDPELAEMLDRAGFLLANDSAIQDMTLYEIASAVEDTSIEDDVLHDVEVMAALQSCAERVRAAADVTDARPAWQRARLQALCQLIEVVLDDKGNVRTDTA